MWMGLSKVYETDEVFSERTMKTLNSLKKCIDAFPLDDPTDETLFEKLQFIRVKFKVSS